MEKFSKNKKLNYVLNFIKEDLEELGHEEVKRYIKEFYGKEPDFNLAQYGNMLVYFDDVRKLYKKAGYKTVDRFSDGKIWSVYLRQVGWVAQHMKKD